MNIKNIAVSGLFLFLFSCGEKKTNVVTQKTNSKPVIKENGKFISFPTDTITLNFFKTQIVSLK